MTHKALIRKLFNDENIYENLDVYDEHDADAFGNTYATINFDGMSDDNQPMEGFVVLVFNPKGRLVQMEVANRKEGKKKWNVAVSPPLLNLVLKGFLKE